MIDKLVKNIQSSYRALVAVAVVFSLIFIGMMLFYFNLEKKTENDYAEQERVLDEIKQSMMIKINGNKGAKNPKLDGNLYDVYDVIDAKCQGNILYDAAYFSENVISISGYNGKQATAKWDISQKVNANDCLILQFTGYAKEKSAKLLVKLNDQSSYIFLDKKINSYFIPFYGLSELDSLSLKLRSEYQDIVIESMYLTNFGSSYNPNELRSGTWNGDDYEKVYISADNQDCFNVGFGSDFEDGYLYKIRSQELQIYQLSEDETFQKLSTVKDIGSAYYVKVIKNRNAVAVASKTDGLYIIDVTDKLNPEILSHFDTIASCVGIELYDDFLYLGNRNSGIEVVDISSLEAPKFVRVFSGSDSADYRNCFVEDHYLYGVWYNKRKIDIFDITDLSNDSPISTIATNGAVQECVVSNGILYTATGNSSVGSGGNIYKYAVGAGNGLDIYDVKNPYNPVWLSTKRFDGRMNINDRWKVDIKDKIAYVYNSYSGIWVVNVEDLCNPLLVSNINITVSKESEKYELLDTEEKIVTFDTSEVMRGSIWKAYDNNDKTLIVTGNLGVVIVD